METNTTIIDCMNAYFETKAVKQDVVTEMPSHSTFDDIKAQVANNTTIGYQHLLKIAGRCVIAERRYTWKGNVAKTSYLHIFIVNDFETRKVREHWREQKNGSFKTI